MRFKIILGLVKPGVQALMLISFILKFSAQIKVYIIIIINNQPTDNVLRPVGWNTLKIGLSSAAFPGLYGI